MVSDILEEELAGTHTKYCTNRTHISKEDIEKIVSLKTKDKCTIKKISQEVKLFPSTVSTILEDKLTSIGSKYSTNQTFISNEDVEKIVQLRRKNVSLNKIKAKLNLPFTLTLSILKSELKGEYQNYNARNIPSEVREKILILYELRALPDEISEITNVSLNTVKFVIQASFDIIFNKIISEIQPTKIAISADECFSFYQDLYSRIKKSTKYRDPLKLTPLAIFFYLKSRNVFVTATEYINAANLTREGFRIGFKTIYPLCGRPARNHRAIAYSLIAQVQNECNLPNSFGRIAKVILDKYGQYIKHTKPEITAGVVCILALLKLKINSVSMLTICNSLGFQLSAALYQVKNKILKRMGINGFQGFIKTSHLIEPLLQSIPLQVH